MTRIPVALDSPETPAAPQAASSKPQQKQASSEAGLTGHLDLALLGVNVGRYEDEIELWMVYGES